MRGGHLNCGVCMQRSAVAVCFSGPRPGAAVPLSLLLHLLLGRLLQLFVGHDGNLDATVGLLALE